MPPGFSGNLIFAIIARMLCGNHLNLSSLQNDDMGSSKRCVKLPSLIFILKCNNDINKQKKERPKVTIHLMNGFP